MSGVGVYGEDASSQSEVLSLYMSPPAPISHIPLTPTPAPILPTPASTSTSRSTTTSSSVSASATTSGLVTSNETSSKVAVKAAPKIISSLQKAFLSPEAFHFCFTQCLSTEVEEVMGLLIGSVDEKEGCCHVTHCLPLKRLDKRKDRVEIGTEQLFTSFSVVEELTNRRKQLLASSGDQAEDDQKPLQVVGWYHSHPHITVFPSDVDVATHHQYQSNMSPFWLGLIFGVFNYEEARATNRFQLIAFQSVDASAGGGRPGLKHIVIPIVVEPRTSLNIDEWSLEKASLLIDLLLQEEKEAFLLHQGNGEGSQQIGRHHNACVYNKAVAKIINFLGAPMIDMLRCRQEITSRS